MPQKCPQCNDLVSPGEKCRCGYIDRWEEGFSRCPVCGFLCPNTHLIPSKYNSWGVVCSRECREVESRMHCVFCKEAINPKDDPLNACPDCLDNLYEEYKERTSAELQALVLVNAENKAEHAMLLKVLEERASR